VTHNLKVVVQILLKAKILPNQKKIRIFGHWW
jgi:hypothetical protein